VPVLCCAATVILHFTGKSRDERRNRATQGTDSNCITHHTHGTVNVISITSNQITGKIKLYIEEYHNLHTNIVRAIIY
jgi:hypothetical protein